MPRQARLDAPDTLRHAMGRGIERPPIFRDEIDRANVLARVAALRAQARSMRGPGSRTTRLCCSAPGAAQAPARERLLDEKAEAT